MEEGRDDVPRTMGFHKTSQEDAKAQGWYTEPIWSQGQPDPKSTLRGEDILGRFKDKQGWIKAENSRKNTTVYQLADALHESESAQVRTKVFDLLLYGSGNFTVLWG